MWNNVAEIFMSPLINPCDIELFVKLNGVIDGLHHILSVIRLDYQTYFAVSFDWRIIYCFFSP